MRVSQFFFFCVLKAISIASAISASTSSSCEQLPEGQEWQCFDGVAWYHVDSDVNSSTTCAIAYIKDNKTTNLSYQDIQYSPFKPYFWLPFYAHDSQKCWFWAECVYDRAQEVRKQQFEATALVMGLIPLTLKDVAWPSRRIVYLGARLDVRREIIVRALGLDPTVVDPARHADVVKWWKTFFVFDWVRKYPWSMIALCSAMMLLTIAATALTEIYSKRSALGCPYPIFVVTFYLVAIFPAAFHVACTRYRLKHPERYNVRKNIQLSETTGGPVGKSISAIQGEDEWWIVQLFWAIYYVAGTLIYTSIMAVTVLELFVWVCVSVALTAACKFSAFTICMLFHARAETQFTQLPSDD
ncbi:hypothetical protein ABEF95_009185 [Exophiala dermatitidis]